MGFGEVLLVLLKHYFNNAPGQMSDREHIM